MATIADIRNLLEDAGQLVGCFELGDAATIPVHGLDCDSRLVRPGHVFACKGNAFRPEYLAAAVRGGAVAYLVDEDRLATVAAHARGVPSLVVRDVRVAMGLVAPLAWGQPERELRICGVTGTKGKTTTCYLLRSMLDVEAARDGATALFGSIETYDGVERMASVNTTPEAPDLWRHLANARDAGLRDVVMEVSSQALRYHRVDGLDFDVAMFLNLGRDHISPVEHPTFEDYRASKLRIFRQSRMAVVNAEGDHMRSVLDAARSSLDRVLTFSAAGNPSADVYATDVRPISLGGEGSASKMAMGTTFVAHTREGALPLRISLPGIYNVENALAAVAAAREYRVGPDAMARGLARASVPGRMEIIEDAASQGVVGVVDFAHNAMALGRLLPAVREAWPCASIIAVFGATGGKGVERRGEMAAEATKWVDQLIFTEDDPGNEDVGAICATMVDAVGGRIPCEVVPDRTEAVNRAAEIAFSWKRQAIICLVGRGTEPTMHRGDELVPFPLDADLLRDALRVQMTSN